ncbi:MAG: L-threonylcarbamoyladenylate synthase [Candidatus Micrarchaeota archaeon]
MTKVKTRVVKVELKDRNKVSKVIDAAVDVISKGGLVIFPTETSYGIAVDATNPTALKRVFEIKERDTDRPLPVMVSDKRMIEEYAEVDERTRFLMKEFASGPLTMVIHRKNLPQELGASGIGFRIPGFELARLIVQEYGKPLTATSANISKTQEPLFNIGEVIETFKGKADLIIDAGDLPKNMPSTVIDMRENPPKVLREGVLTKEVLRVLEKA